MPIPDNIKELAAQLHYQVEHDLTPEEFIVVQFARADIEEVLVRYSEAGKVALSLAAADFAAE